MVTETENKGKIFKKEVMVVKKFNPSKRIKLDGETVFEIIAERKIMGNLEEILVELKHAGLILNRANAPDCVSGILTKEDIPTESGHATYGVYKSGDSLEFCTEPFTRSDTHKEIKTLIEKFKDIKITGEDFLNWQTLSQFWNTYEFFLLWVWLLSLRLPTFSEIKVSWFLIFTISHRSLGWGRQRC